MRAIRLQYSVSHEAFLLWRIPYQHPPYGSNRYRNARASPPPTALPLPNLATHRETPASDLRRAAALRRAHTA